MEDEEVIRQEIDIYRIVSGKDSFMNVFLEDISSCLKITLADDFKCFYHCGNAQNGTLAV